jgi:hypothetical protein
MFRILQSRRSCIVLKYCIVPIYDVLYCTDIVTHTFAVYDHYDSFKLCPNIVLNRVFQCEKQFCLDFRIFLCRFGGIHYFLGFRTSFTLILSMVKNVVFGFLSMFFVFFIFRRTLFVHFLCCFVCLVGVGGQGNGASV